MHGTYNSSIVKGSEWHLRHSMMRQGAPTESGAGCHSAVSHTERFNPTEALPLGTQQAAQ